MTAGVKTRLRNNSLHDFMTKTKWEKTWEKRVNWLVRHVKNHSSSLDQMKLRVKWSLNALHCIIFRCAWSLDKLNSLQRGLPHMTFALEGGGESKRSRRSVGGCMNCTVYFSYKMRIWGRGVQKSQTSYMEAPRDEGRENQHEWFQTRESLPTACAKGNLATMRKQLH